MLNYKHVTSASVFDVYGERLGIELTFQPEDVPFTKKQLDAVCTLILREHG
jgi:hypothetical protein